MIDYYADTLYGEALKKCYDIAPPRVQQYLRAEIQYVAQQIKKADLVLELGCGYGRVLKPVSAHAKSVVGIDTSYRTLKVAQHYISQQSHCHLIAMDASHLGFGSNTFDAVLCVQNGISAFRVDSSLLVEESIRVTRPGGLILFSSYSPEFWEHRLKWFRIQAREGLIGEIDESKTIDGIIECKDGLKLTFVGKEQFLKLFTRKNTRVSVVDVDKSSVFCRVEVLKDVDVYPP